MREEERPHDRRLRPERRAGDHGRRRGGLRQGADRAAAGAPSSRSRGGSVYATDSGSGRQGLEGRGDVDAARVGRLQARRQDGAQGRLRPLLRHPERRRLHPNNHGLQLDDRPTPTARTSARRSCSATRSGRARHLRPVPGPRRRDALRSSRPGRPSAWTRSRSARLGRATQSRTRTTSTRGSSGGAWRSSASLPATSRSRSPTTARTRTASRRASGRTTCRSSTGSRAAERARRGRAGAARRRTSPNPYAHHQLRGAADHQPGAVSADGRQRLLHVSDGAAEPPAAAVLADQQPDLRQPAARRSQGPLAPGQRQPPLRRRLHGERRAVVQQHRANRTVEEFDREPTLWQDNNNSRPCRVSGGAVYELPFGPGKPLLKDGGVLAALAGGWQTGRHVRVSARLAARRSTTTCSSTATSTTSRRSKPEIALNADGTLDPTKYWFNIENFERDPTKTPTSFQTRAFPFQIDGLRGPGPDLRQHERRRAPSSSAAAARSRHGSTSRTCSTTPAYNNPSTDPTNTNFGKVVAAVASAGAMRFFNFVARLTF